MGVYSATDTCYMGETTLTFTNTRDGTIPTGLESDLRGPLLLTLFAAELVLTLFYLGKRRRRA